VAADASADASWRTAASTISRSDWSALAAYCSADGRAGGGLRVLPGLFGDPYALGKQQVGLLADFLPDIHGRAWSGFYVGQRFVNEQPQAPWTLQTRDVARLGEVWTSHLNVAGLSMFPVRAKAIPTHRQLLPPLGVKGGICRVGRAD
jgi:hypothetical protein